MSKKKVIRKKSYTICLEIYEDGQEGIVRTNDGFNAFELLGLLDMTSRDIIEQMTSKSNRPVVVKKVVVDQPSSGHGR